MTNVNFAEVYAAAHAAGHAAAMAAVPPAMVVTNGAESWCVADGPCGFAWITVRPGNSPLARWLKANGHAHTAAYGRGVLVWVHDYNQSMARKTAYGPRLR
jgi:hypothetical protein